MRRLPRILSLIVAALIVIVALLISGLRILMPYMNDYRPRIMSVVSAITDSNLSAGELTGRWENFGPAIEIKDLQSTLDDGTELEVSHVRLALDVWQSLLHARLQFRDLTFWQLQLTLPALPATSSAGSGHLASEQLNNLFCISLTTLSCVTAALPFPPRPGK